MAHHLVWRSPLPGHYLGWMLLLFTTLLLTSAVSAQTGDPDYTCSATKPCALGCCGKNGVCGMGPDYCSPANCVNSCTAKSECDPANWGPQYAANTKCPLNVCCSKFGFCGTTPEFCGTTQIANPSCPGGKSAIRRTIGYYEGWGVGRACDAMLPEQIPVSAYTHINFAFAMIDPVSFAVAPMSDGDVALYPRLTALKALYPNLKVWISIGGWTMNDPDQPTATTFSDLAGSTANQQKFFASLIAFMSHYGFDGVDIDWEYPVAAERSGRPADYQNYPVFLRNLRNAFQAAGKNWGVTITMPSSFWYLQHFDIVKLEPVVDWFNMMAYVAAHTNLTEIDQSLKLLWRNSIPPSKVVLGLGFYGRSYTLADPSCSKPGCVFTSGAPAGPCTNSIGTLSYGEIQRLLQAGAKPVLDAKAAVQMLTYGEGGRNLVSYDDATTLKMKIDYANANCLGGTMVWAASTDDSKGSAAAALRTASGGSVGPLSAQLAFAFPPDNPRLCSWTRCGGLCPAGTTAAAYVLDGCPQPTTSPFNYRLFCCPVNDVPDCNYRVQDLSGKTCVAGTCPTGTQLLTTTQFILVPYQLCPAGGHINWCCSQSKSLTSTLGQCTWTGCGGSCPSGSTLLTQTLTGDGGDSPCPSGRRSLCCPAGSSSSGFIASTCGWYRNAFHNTCTPGCPEGKVQLAVDSAGASCVRGFGSFCCDPPTSLLAGRGDPQVQDFQRLVHAFMTAGTCSAHDAGIPRRRKRQVSSLLNPSSRDMAARLLPMLFDWEWSSLERGYIRPYQQMWDDERVATGGVFPTFDTLALGLLEYSPIEGDSIDYLDDVLCYGRFGTDAINGDRATASHLCTVVGGQVRKRGEFIDFVPRLEVRWAAGRVAEVASPSNETLSKRWFINRWAVGGTRWQNLPELGDAFDLLANNVLRPEFYNFFRYQGNQIEMEVVFLLGFNPDNLSRFLQPNANARYLVMHIHFNPNALINGRLAINQINIRHAQRIQAQENPPVPGRYRVGLAEITGEEAFRCSNQATGLDPATIIPPSSLQEELVLEVVQDIGRWGVNRDLFNQANPDPSTLRRVETGPRAGNLVHNGGSTVPMFANALFANGQGGLAFAPDGSLYDPFARNGGDIVNTPGFFAP
ncbi:hypothetical protein C8A05DRAFT_16453 [Staphylotrichum tortipilum]|uniref:chitinase n=1 Tax=Staphylotrichum tortipilum TaxID=2831512 RepID=A0AAN6RS31_9PEZI|nr:hypothetical protein C8A05DRAFT_16453 [Staphylotrichum longicolle]